MFRLVLSITKHVAVGTGVTRPSPIYFDVMVSVSYGQTCGCWHRCDEAKSYIL